MKRERPAEQDTARPCPLCGGKGRVPSVLNVGKRKRTKVCIQCRGSGKATYGYLVK